MEEEGESVLPEEMVYEIITRTSLDTLAACEVVSKRWRKMIQEPSFGPLHRRRSRIISGYFFHNEAWWHNSVLVNAEGGAAVAGINERWDQNDMRILASSEKGLLCCDRQINAHDYRFYVCKPATDQWQCLPNPQLRYRTEGVAIVVVKYRPLRYKIIRLSASDSRYISELFDSETWEWKRTEAASHLHNDDEIHRDHRYGAITVGQSIHWLTAQDNVLALDTRTMSFNCFPLPESCKDDTSRLQKYEGRIGFTSYKRGNHTLELWAGGDQRNEWTRKVVVDMRFPEETWSVRHPVEFCNRSIVFMTTDGEAVFYNHQDRTFVRVGVPYNPRYPPPTIFGFQSDMEIVNLSGR